MTLARRQFAPSGTAGSTTPTANPPQLLVLKVLRTAIVDAQRGDTEALRCLTELVELHAAEA